MKERRVPTPVPPGAGPPFEAQRAAPERAAAEPEARKLCVHGRITP